MTEEPTNRRETVDIIGAAPDRRVIDDKRTVHERMVDIIGALPAIGKTQKNTQQNFMFRGHDDVMNALNPLLAEHGVHFAPRVLERITGERKTSKGSTMYEVNLHVQFTFYGLLGDDFTASGWGEGTDMGDKATSKAMTMALKYVISQTFALATQDTSHADADAGTPEATDRPVEEASKEQVDLLVRSLLEEGISGDVIEEKLEAQRRENRGVIPAAYVAGNYVSSQQRLAAKKEPAQA